MVDGFAKSPRYVLKQGAIPTCPPLVQAVSDAQTSAIFGFSSKPAYDVFMSASTLALTPYPLIKRFLQSQIDLDLVALNLVVLDAVSSTERYLYAASFQTILESLQLGSDRVTISHRLTLDDATASYKIESFSLLSPVKPLS